MTDQELIREARKQLRDTDNPFRPYPGYDLLEQLTDRLEKLLTLYDESEKWCAILANDRECDGGMIQIGVAKALAAVRENAARYSGNTMFAEGRANGHKDAISAIEAACGPAALPPHEQTLAENRRMREALAEIAGRGVGTSPGSREIAREALLGGVLNPGTDTS